MVLGHQMTGVLEVSVANDLRWQVVGMTSAYSTRRLGSIPAFSASRRNPPKHDRDREAADVNRAIHFVPVQLQAHLHFTD